MIVVVPSLSSTETGSEWQSVQASVLAVLGVDALAAPVSLGCSSNPPCWNCRMRFKSKKQGQCDYTEQG